MIVFKYLKIKRLYIITYTLTYAVMVLPTLTYISVSDVTTPDQRDFGVGIVIISNLIIFEELIKLFRNVRDCKFLRPMDTV